jgi:hypothetical protein
VNNDDLKEEGRKRGGERWREEKKDSLQAY